MQWRWGVGAALLLMLGAAFWLHRGEPGAPTRAPRPAPPLRVTRPVPEHPPLASAAPSSALPRAQSAPSADPLNTAPASPELYWKNLEAWERSDKRRALEYALNGDTWYPEEGQLQEARRAKIVTLLVELGEMPEARARTRAFIEQYPRSVYRPLVQGVTGIHPRPGAPPSR